jgi:hypothetical protein
MASYAVCLECYKKGIPAENVNFMDDTRLIPLLVSNTVYWWDTAKTYLPLQVHYLADYYRDQTIQLVYDITSYMTSEERVAYGRWINSQSNIYLDQIETMLQI